MIQVQDLSKRYGNNPAVDAVSFDVAEGKIYGFLGPNGAGKSSIMNMITGCLAPDAGKVLIDGYDIQSDPIPAKKRIGYLPELPPVYPEMTVREYLGFVCELKGIPASERKEHVTALMERTQISHMSERLIRHLSKGYRQRVGLAQAAAGDPKYIILDEPTVGLDPKQIMETRDFIRSMRGKQTVIISSHILLEISAVCDHIIILSHGRLIACDSRERLGRYMDKRHRIRLAVRGTQSRIAEVLEKLPMAETLEVEFSDAEEPDIRNVTIRHADGQDPREEVFYALAEARCPILHMTSEEQDLEEIFLRLTTAEETAGKEGGEPDASRI